MKDRTSQILEILAQGSKVEVSALAQRLGVSQVTMRKDLDLLEKQGLLLREHGYALLRSADDISGRIAFHYEEKRKIALCAAGLVSDGETLMIESGSCCALLAAELAATKRDLTIVTNSAFIAQYVRGKPGAQVVLLGGIYQPDSQVLVGPLIRKCAGSFYVHRLFIGADGYSQPTGFTNRDQLRAQAVRDMAEQAEEVVVLTESAKFACRGTVPLNLQDHRQRVVTDSQAPQSVLSQLADRDIPVLMG